MKAPKYITDHPAVDFYDTGANQSSDYRHYVELRDGWAFTEGRHAGSTSLFFMNQAQFDHAGARQASDLKLQFEAAVERGDPVGAVILLAEAMLPLDVDGTAVEIAEAYLVILRQMKLNHEACGQIVDRERLMLGCIRDELTTMLVLFDKL